MRDFTSKTYKRLLQSLMTQGYKFQTVEQYAISPEYKVVILRHDIDSWPSNALIMASVESGFDIKSTYYFRKSPLSFNDGIIRSIAAMGHEIGYHYEDLSTCRGDFSKAIQSFQRNLDFFRKYYPVQTIAMHGRPLSQWNNLDLWQRYKYQDYGIIAEPYISIDFNKVLYLTDTGNCWDGNKYSVRDHVKSEYSYNIHTSFDLIRNIEGNSLPNQILLNIHPARWNDNLIKWLFRYYILTLPKYQIKKWVKAWRKKQQ